LGWAPSRCSGLGASLRLSHGGPPLEARPRKGAGPRKGAWGEGRGPRGGGGAGGWVARRRRRNFCGPCTKCFFGDLCGPCIGYARASRSFGRLASGRGRPSRSGWLELAGGGRGSVQGHGFADARFPKGDALDGSLAGSVASDGRGWVRLPREPWPVHRCSSARTLTLGKVAGGDPGEGHVPPHLARGPAGGLGSRGAAGARGDWAIKAPPAAKGPGTAGPRGVGGAPGRGDGSQRIHMYVTCPCRTRLAHTDVARDRQGAQGTHGNAFGGATAAARALEPRRGASQGAPEAWGPWGGGGRGVRPWGAVWFSRVDF